VQNKQGGFTHFENDFQLIIKELHMKELKNTAEQKPTIREQIHFIKRVRHIIEEVPDGQVVFDQENADMLRAIEENLVAVRLISGDING
jgi:hypothetical protein